MQEKVATEKTRIQYPLTMTVEQRDKLKVIAEKTFRSQNGALLYMIDSFYEKLMQEGSLPEVVA